MPYFNFKGKHISDSKYMSLEDGDRLEFIHYKKRMKTGVLL